MAKRDLAGLKYKVTEDKWKRVIIDTDAACEADDPYAIAHALMSKKLDIRAIFAEQFHEPGSTRKSYDEIMAVLDCMDMSVPVFMGEEGPLEEIEESSLSPAAEFLIEEAMREAESPLYVLCMGALTNVASAIRKNSAIISKMTVVWIGGHSHECVNPDHREFNCGNDVKAANLVISSGVEFWQIPNNVYGTMHIGLAEIQKKIYPYGKIGKHLYENTVNFNESEHAGWTAGESWSLGDSPSVGVVIEPNCGSSVYKEAPIINEDTSYCFEMGRPKIKVYTSINSRFILEDFFAKLQLLYPYEER